MHPFEAQMLVDDRIQERRRQAAKWSVPGGAGRSERLMRTAGPLRARIGGVLVWTGDRFQRTGRRIQLAGDTGGCR